MTHLVQSLELPHWLMLVGALLVIAGCIGLAISPKRAAEIDDEATNEPSPEPPAANAAAARPPRFSAQARTQTVKSRSEAPATATVRKIAVGDTASSPEFTHVSNVGTGATVGK
jgi:hypothetical protein